MIELLLAPVLAGAMLALVSGPMGCFVVWGRMAYFGDTLAHAALLGIALALLLGWHPLVGVLLLGALLALALARLQRQHSLTSDTVLGIFAHAALALGLVLISLTSGLRLDLHSLLFGDLLAVQLRDLLWIALLTLIIAVTLWRSWRALLILTISPDLAQAEGLPVLRLRTLQLVLLASLVAIGLQVVGALLMTALLIIPAAAARRWAQTPEQMAGFASLIGLLSVLVGMLLSWGLDTPTGPSIVVSATVFFLGSLLRRVA